MKRTKEYEDARKQLNRDAVTIANRKIRELKLNTLVSEALQLSIADWLDKYWNPYEVDYEFTSGFGMRLNITDPTVKKIMADENLYEVAADIVHKATQEALTGKGVAPFIEALLNEVIIEGRNFD